MERGEVGWAGGSKGPDYFIYLGTGPASWLGNPHEGTIWADVADEASMASARRILMLVDSGSSPFALVSLLNLLLTFALALALTFLIQTTIVLVWRHLINRRYYRRERAIAAARAMPKRQALPVEKDSFLEKKCVRQRRVWLDSSRNAPRLGNCSRRALGKGAGVRDRAGRGRRCRAPSPERGLD